MGIIIYSPCSNERHLLFANSYLWIIMLLYGFQTINTVTVHGGYWYRAPPIVNINSFG